MKELRFENAFIDGTKLEANAGRYSFVWKGATEKHKARLLPKVEAFLAEVKERYGVEFGDIDGVVNYLEHLEFERSYGKGKRKSSPQRDLDIARMEYVLKNYDDIKLSNKTTKSYKNSDNTQAKIVTYIKRINGNFFVAEAMPDSKSKKLIVLSVYKNKVQ